MKQTFYKVFIVSALCACFGAFAPRRADAQTPPRAGVPAVAFPADTADIDPETFTLGNDFVGHFSHGWFPAPYAAHTLSIIFPYTTIKFRFDAANDVRPRGIGDVPAPFSTRNPFASSDDREIAKAGLREERESDYLEAYYRETGFRYLLQLPVPAMLQLGLMYKWGTNMLFANNENMKFLNRDGVPQSFQEVRVLAVTEDIAHGAVGVTLPVYGVFADLLEQMTLASYYYLHLGVSADYALSSKTAHYWQIASPKDDLRYRQNVADTTSYFDGAFANGGALPDLRRLRTALELGVGWTTGAAVNIGASGSAGGQFSTELFAHLPLTGYLVDDSWKTYVVGFRFVMGYQWLLGKRSTP